MTDRVFVIKSSESNGTSEILRVWLLDKESNTRLGRIYSAYPLVEGASRLFPCTKRAEFRGRQSPVKASIIIDQEPETRSTAKCRLHQAVIAQSDTSCLTFVAHKILSRSVGERTE